MKYKNKTVLAIVVLLIIIAGLGFWNNGIRAFSDMFTNTKALENVYYIFQIITSFALIIGAIIGVWQYVLTSRSARAQIGNGRIQKAVDLAEYYKDNILPELEVFTYIFEKLEIKKIIDDIKPQDMKAFDSKELEDNLSKAKMDSIQKIITDPKTLEVLKEIKKIYGKDFEFLDIVENSGEENLEILRRVMSKSINKVLNNMEFFAMHFTHKTADSSVVYQSLHQTYIRLVRLFYYDISVNNKLDGKQYFTNVTNLYKEWYNKSEEANNKLAEAGRKSISTGTKADDLIK